MILKGSQRSGAGQLSAHLMNERDNDHVTLYQVRGFIADDLAGALDEAHAISNGTRCEKFLFSLSLNPPQTEDVPEKEFLDAIEQAEERLGLKGQPRAIVFHEKEARRHAHVVWSRIEPYSLKAIPMGLYKKKLACLSKELFLDHGWPLPEGFRRDDFKNPLNFTLAEWQQAKRNKRDPREIKEILQDCWHRCDGAKAFSNALEERGFYLARGDRRGFVALDSQGEVYSIPRWINLKTKDVRARLGNAELLPGVAEVKQRIGRLFTGKVQSLIDDCRRFQDDALSDLQNERLAMRAAHRIERGILKGKQEERWQAESRKRRAQIKRGLSGLWDVLSGRARQVNDRNLLESRACLARDQDQRDGLVFAQMKDRRALQERINRLRRKTVKDRRLLDREIAQYLRMAEFREVQEKRRRRSRSRSLTLNLSR